MSIVNQYSATNYSQICNNPCNTSISKQQYSFSKQKRFQLNKSYCETAFYNLPEVLSKRAADLGRGQKFDISKTMIISPSPDRYNIHSIFECSTTKGRTFGQSRDKMSEFSYIPKNIQGNPGPNKYEIKSRLKTDGVSMRPKTISLYNPVFLDGKTTQLQNPGPGYYKEKDTINKDGKYLNSTMKSTAGSKFSPHTSRFEPIKNNAPGPGAYDIKKKNEVGESVLSVYKGEGNRLFPKAQRKDFIEEKIKKTIAPGPGNYRLPSDFGHYEKSITSIKSVKRKGNNKHQ